MVPSESRSGFEIYSRDSRVTSKYFEVTVESPLYGSHLKMLHLFAASRIPSQGRRSGWMSGPIYGVEM